MPGPGEYRPDPSQGITRIEDLPKPKIRCQSRNYRRRPCPRCGQSASRSLSEYLLVLSHGRWISLGFGLSASAQPCACTIPLNLPRRCRSGGHRVGFQCAASNARRSSGQATGSRPSRRRTATVSGDGLRTTPARGRNNRGVIAVLSRPNPFGLAVDGMTVMSRRSSRFRDFAQGSSPCDWGGYPQSTPVNERRQIFKRLWVKQISCHSADTFSRPRNRNLRIPRAT